MPKITIERDVQVSPIKTIAHRELTLEFKIDTNANAVFTMSLPEVIQLMNLIKQQGFKVKMHD